MLTCKDITERSSLYLDGELSCPRKLAFRLHMLVCSVCRTYVTQLEATRAAAAEGAAAVIPPELLERLHTLRETTTAVDSTDGSAEA